MATMTVRSSYALDPATDTRILRLSKLWNVSKAEVIRRSIAQVETGAEESQGRKALAALDRLQRNTTLTEKDVTKWEQRRRADWAEAWGKSELNAKSARKKSL